MGAADGGIGEVEVRRARDDELDEVVDLCGRALGWRAGEPNAELFRWKHRDNPFGASPTWVAIEGGRILAVRTFLRWELARPDGSVVGAVRAVDTATDPAAQGRGLFRLLTTSALPELAEEGVGFVYNTPNDQSRPGYVSMGWEVVGRIPVGLGVAGPRALARLAGARTAAAKWSEATPAGVPAAALLDDADAVGALLAAAPAPEGLATRRSPAQLAWRYAEGPVRYRAVALGDVVDEGLAVFRVRRRGTALEATVVEVLVPDRPDAATRRRQLVDRIRAETGCDHALAVVRGRRQAGLVRVAQLGPVLTWRAVVEQRCPPLDEWDLSLGDVELF